MNSNVRQRRSTGTSGSSSGSSGRARANAGGMWHFYTDDSPGIKIGPVPVLVMSLVFILCVFMLHIWDFGYDVSNNMFNLIIWLFVFPRLLYHIILILLIVLLIISYRVFKVFKTGQGSVIQKGRMMMSMHFNRIDTKRNTTSKSFHNVAHLSLAIVLIVWLPMPMKCENQDAIILKPVVSIVKSFIGLVADKKPLNFDFSSADVARSVGLLVWRARFPMRMPNGVVQKAQDLVNRINTRVNETDVSLLTRKTISQLGQDVQDIVNAINAEVKASPDGIYTDYLETDVSGKPLEEALYDVSLQLKAYQIDLINYRDLADMLLGLPIVPHVVGGINTAVSAAPNIQTLKDITKALANNSNQAATMARGVMQQGASSVSTLGNNIPGVSSITGMISTPISAVGNTVFNQNGLGGVMGRFVPSIAPSKPIDANVKPMNETPVSAA